MAYDLQQIITLAGTAFICGFGGYTMGQVFVYLLTSNKKSAVRSGLFTGIFSLALAIGSNAIPTFIVTYWQFLWNGIILLVSVFVGYYLANRNILNINFNVPLPDGLPIDSDESKTGVLVLTKGETEDYNPIPLILRYRKKRETGVEVKNPLAQPFEFNKERRKYKRLFKSMKEETQEGIVVSEPKNPYKEHLKEIVSKLEESFLDVDYYQEAYANEWPSFTQGILRLISLGCKDITVLRLFYGENFDYQQALDDFKKIDYSELGITVKETALLSEGSGLAELLVNKIKSSLPNKSSPSTAAVVLVGEGQPKEWDDDFQGQQQEESFIAKLKKHLRSSGFSENLIQTAWLDERSPTITEALETFADSDVSTIVVAPVSIIVDGIDTLINIPEAIEAASLPDSKQVIQIDVGNAAEEYLKVYLARITDANPVDLVKLGEKAVTVINASNIGASLDRSAESKADTETSQATPEEQPKEESSSD